MRFVCASHPPGPRYAWPCFVVATEAGSAQREGSVGIVSSRLPDAAAPFVASPSSASSPSRRKRPRPRTPEPLTDAGGVLWARRALQQAVRDCVALVDRMRNGGILQDRHSRHHPALSVPETASVMADVMDRVRRHAADLGQALRNPNVLPRDVVDTAARMPLATLNEAAYRLDASFGGTAAGGIIPRDDTLGPAADAGPPTPVVLLAVWARLMEDLAFLRSMLAYGRREIIAFTGIRQHPPGTVHSTRREYRIPEATGAAALSCRIATRPSLNWSHVFRVMFPDQYHRFRREDQRDGERGPLPTSYVYRSQLVVA